MPNWCSNYIVISGDVDKISLLKNVLEDVPKSKEDDSIVFTTLIGKEPEISTEDYEKGGWFDSNVKWFGTKWDVSYSDCQFEFGDDSIIMMPMTAWSCAMASTAKSTPWARTFSCAAPRSATSLPNAPAAGSSPMPAWISKPGSRPACAATTRQAADTKNCWPTGGAS